MRMSKPLKVLSTAALALTVAGGVIFAAHADETPTTPPVNPQVVELRDSLTALGVDAVTQERLVYKFFVLGQRLDGDTDAAPVDEQTWSDAAGVHTRFTYADGSKSETVVQQQTPKRVGSLPAAAGGPGASGCDHTRSQDIHDFNSCRVSMSRPTYKMSFVLSYHYQQFGCGIDHIGSVASGGLGIDPATKSIEYPRKTSKQHAGICHATVTVIQTIGIGPASFKSTAGIDVRVQSSSEWANKLSLQRIDE